jgi:hypothetical protein
MASGLKICCLLYPLAACVFLSPATLRAQSTVVQTNQPAVAPSDLAAAMAQYRRALEIYTNARQSFAAISTAYWNSISEKRHLRNTKRAGGEQISIEDYVLDQPPVYTGPPKPRNPSKPESAATRVYGPVVADFLAAAQR